MTPSGNAVHSATSARGSGSRARLTSFSSTKAPRRASTGSHSSVARTEIPVVRRGQLVRATSRADGTPRALTLEQSRQALKLLAAEADDTLEKIRSAMIARFPQGKATFNAEAQKGLAAAGRAASLGVIYNYQEFALHIEGAVVVVRPTVTLCIQPANDLRDARPIPFSKFWTRFILTSHPRLTDGAPSAEQDEVVRWFDEACKTMHEAAMSSLVSIYGTALAEAMGEPLDLNIEDNGAFSVLTLSVHGADTQELFTAASEGATFSVQMSKAPLATQRLLELAGPRIAANQALAAEDPVRALREDDRCQVIFYESPEDDQGLYFMKATDTLATFVGIAWDRGDDTAERIRKNPARASHSPSNVVSAGLSSQYGRIF